jgi:hypothetical protein
VADLPVGKGSYYELLRSNQAVLDVADNLDAEHFGTTGGYFKLVLGMSQYRGQIEQFLGKPTTSLGYSIFEYLEGTAGVIGTNLYWRVDFQSSLPPDAKSIICVVSNSFN